jgi:antitoxin YobK
MKKLIDIVEKAKKSEEELVLYGSQSENSIELLCKSLKIKLPDSYKKFLELYGGGGWEAETGFSGIYNEDALNKNRGYLFGDTLRCRELYSLPTSLVVIYCDFDDEIIWCLDVANFDEQNECKVVQYDTASNLVTGKVSDNFLTLAEEYFNHKFNEINY